MMTQHNQGKSHGSGFDSAHLKLLVAMRRHACFCMLVNVKGEWEFESPNLALKLQLVTFMERNFHLTLLKSLLLVKFGYFTSNL